MLDCFKRDYTKPSREYASHGEGRTFKPVWGYVVPHTRVAQGAETPDNKWSEYSHGMVTAPLTELPYSTRDDGGVKGAVKRLIGFGLINASWEDHRNAYNEKVGGAEILYMHGDDLSKYYAEMILESFAAKFPDRKIRGAKGKRKGDRGYNNLLLAKKGGVDVALLGELFFIDNPKDFIEPAVMAEFLKSVLV